MRRNGQKDGATGKVLQIKEAHVTADTAYPGSPADATFHDLLSLAITSSTGTHLEIDLAAQIVVDPGSAAQLAGMQVVVDGVAVPGSLMLFVNVLSAVAGPAGQVKVLVAVSAGAHTVKIQWESIQGTPHINATASPAFQYARLVVAEVVKS